MTTWRKRRRDGEGRRGKGQVKNKRKPLKEQRRGKEAVGAGTEKRVDEGVRNMVNNSNRIDGLLEARGRVASGITPGLLPWATGSEDLLLHKLGNARWW